MCPSLIQILANPLADKTLAARVSCGGDEVGRGSGCSAAAPNLPSGAAKAIYGYCMFCVTLYPAADCMISGTVTAKCG